MQSLVITIDGPAGTGKSTVAFGLAQRLGLEFLDTGAMYRALTVCCMRKKIDPATDPDAAVQIANATQLRFDWTCQPPKLFAGGSDVTAQLRTPDVSAHVSDLAVIPAVRTLLVNAQQRIAERHPRLVSEGRDQGSIVFPGAQFKFYLDAHAEARAQRRVDQIRGGGGQADHQKVLEHIVQRDHQDSNRKDGPLICPQDAVRVDTSHLDAAGVIDQLEQHIQRHLKSGSTVNPTTPAQATISTTTPTTTPESR